MAIKLTRMDGGTADISPETLQAFKAVFRGPALTALDPEYEESRKIWNAMIDRRPGLVARCTGTVDVVQAVRFARHTAGTWRYERRARMVSCGARCTRRRAQRRPA
jgi:hypothetical protein